MKLILETYPRSQAQGAKAREKRRERHRHNSNKAALLYYGLLSPPNSHFHLQLAITRALPNLKLSLRVRLRWNLSTRPSLFSENACVPSCRFIIAKSMRLLGIDANAARLKFRRSKKAAHKRAMLCAGFFSTHVRRRHEKYQKETDLLGMCGGRWAQIGCFFKTCHTVGAAYLERLKQKEETPFTSHQHPGVYSLSLA